MQTLETNIYKEKKYEKTMVAESGRLSDLPEELL